MKCPYCGSTNVEKHGDNPGDLNWFLCRDCSKVWDAEPRKKETE